MYFNLASSLLLSRWRTSTSKGCWGAAGWPVRQFVSNQPVRFSLAQVGRVKGTRLFNGESVDQIAAGRSSADWLAPFKS
jgi:hypothetical protein